MRQAKGVVSGLVPLDSIPRQIWSRGLEGFFVLREDGGRPARERGASLAVHSPESELHLGAGDAVFQANFVGIVGGRRGRRLDLVATSKETCQENGKVDPRHSTSRHLRKLPAPLHRGPRRVTRG